MTALDNAASGGLTAPEIIRQMEAQYQALTVNDREREKTQKGLGVVFDKWFRSASPTEPEPLYADFLLSVQTLANQLADALCGLDAEERGKCAVAAAKIMLRPKPVDQKTQAEWFMVAAEYSFSALIPYLPADAIAKIRDEYVRDTPKRMMYPRQRDLLKLMESRRSSRD